MDKTPAFIKDFSKEESPEERQRVAQSVRAKRQEHFTEVKLSEEKRLEAERISSEQEKASNEKLESINNLENEISRLSESGLSKILNYFELKKLQADLVLGQKTFKELKQQRDLGLTGEKLSLENTDKNQAPSLLQEAKAMVDGFYSKQEKKWGDSEYKKEDIEKYFSEDNLASLSLEDYTLLLKRFPSEMVAHVTRQGVRDHLGHMYHTAGDGEYANGFKNMAKDGRLRSPLGVYLVEEEKEKAIAKFLGLEVTDTKEEALKNLNILTDPEHQESGSYIDRMAIHFATEQVADCFYGSEKGNEIFIAYPSAYIASQYYFEGQLNQAGGGYWNDQWVWANEEKGIGLNAGIVFIPEKANVDKETGSRYELDKDKNPIKNTEYATAVRKLVDSDNFDDFAKQASEITGKLRIDGSIEKMKSVESLKPLLQRLEKDFNIVDPRLQLAVLDYEFSSTITIITERDKEKISGEEDPFYSVSSSIESALRNNGILFKEATNKVSSREYWESYFEKNPESKPAHIVYYKGEDPTRALDTWKEENGLDKKAVDENIGFIENRVMQSDDPQVNVGIDKATAGMDRFKTLAENVIENYYTQKEVELKK